jgi:hypothetical protein
MVQSPSWEANWFAASQEIPRISRNRRFITALTSTRHLFLSWVTPIQSIYPHPTSWRSVLIILSTHLCLGLPSGLFPSGFPTKTLYTPSPHPYAPHAHPISFFSILSPARYWVRSTDFAFTFYICIFYLVSVLFYIDMFIFGDTVMERLSEWLIQN